MLPDRWVVSSDLLVLRLRPCIRHGGDDGGRYLQFGNGYYSVIVRNSSVVFAFFLSPSPSLVVTQIRVNTLNRFFYPLPATYGMRLYVYSDNHSAVVVALSSLVDSLVELCADDSPCCGSALIPTAVGSSETHHVCCPRLATSSAVCVVFASNRSFYQTTSSVHPSESVLILHPREVQILWSQTL